MEVIQCRNPSKSYAISLIEKWLQFQINKMAQHESLPFEDYRKFIDFCKMETIGDRAKLPDFYMHNLILTNMNLWDPN